MKNINLKELNEILDDCISFYLFSVKKISSIGPTRSFRKATPGFPILRPANDEYFEFKYFEGTLEWYIRDYLVNDVFEDLLVPPEFDCKWLDQDRRIVGASNESIENHYPLEFILRIDDKKIGFRYTIIPDEDINKYTSLFGLEKIVVIAWKDEEQFRDCYAGDERVDHITIKQFFENYISSDAYEVYIDRVKKAVAESNDMIGFQTIPQLSLRYLSDFKDNVKLELADHQKFPKHYKLLNPSRWEVREYKTIERESFTPMDMSIIETRFIKEERFKALVGEEEFARCFITAEYLFNTLYSQNQFDYTAIACGYLKAIEQLIYKIVTIELDLYPNKQLFIKKKGTKKDIEGQRKNKNGHWEIPFISDNKKFFNIEMGSLIYYIKGNPDIWKLQDVDPDTLFKYLMCFSKECRNEHFHKDNIKEYEDVRTIRNNALIIARILLGGCRLSGDAEKDKELLGIKDDSFESLYKKMIVIPTHVKKFILQFGNVAEVKAIRLYDQHEPSYDSFGSLRESSIRFARVDDLKIGDYDEFIKHVSPDDILEINKENVPTKVWFVRRDGKSIIV